MLSKLLALCISVLTLTLVYTIAYYKFVPFTIIALHFYSHLLTGFVDNLQLRLINIYFTHFFVSIIHNS